MTEAAPPDKVILSGMAFYGHHGTKRAPAPEHDRSQGNEAAPCSDVLGECSEPGERELTASDPGQRAANN